MRALVSSLLIELQSWSRPLNISVEVIVWRDPKGSARTFGDGQRQGNCLLLEKNKYFNQRLFWVWLLSLGRAVPSGIKEVLNIYRLLSKLAGNSPLTGWSFVFRVVEWHAWKSQLLSLQLDFLLKRWCGFFSPIFCWLDNAREEKGRGTKDVFCCENAGDLSKLDFGLDGDLCYQNINNNKKVTVQKMSTIIKSFSSPKIKETGLLINM